jgi:hypothetical protein
MTDPVERAMTDPVEAAARSAALVLASDLGPSLPAEVETVLAARYTGEQRPGQYDPVAIAALGIGAADLIVSIAQLAWSIISEQHKHTAQPLPDATARQVRIALRQQDIAVSPSTDHITEVVITELIRLEDPPQQQAPDP